MRRFSAIVLFSLLAPVTALAQTTGTSDELDQLNALAQPEVTRAEELAAQAETAYVDGDFARAISLLQQAYAASENPNMLYNIARVHEADGNLLQALEYYRQFVVAPGVDIDYRREALQSSAALEQKIEENRAKEQQELIASEAGQQAPTAAGDEPARVIYPAPFPTTSALRPLGFVLAGVGAATIAGGAGFGVAALAKESKFNDATTLAERRALGSATRDLATAADAMYISGAVLIVTGIVTAFASPKRERDVVNSGLSLRFGADGMGAVWTQSF